jgi:hypothetical protein
MEEEVALAQRIYSHRGLQVMCKINSLRANTTSTSMGEVLQGLPSVSYRFHILSVVCLNDSTNISFD